MPIPKPITGESEDDFISRCMGDDTMADEYEPEQSRAICQSAWDDSKKSGTFDGVLFKKKK